MGQINHQLSSFKKPFIPGLNIKFIFHRINDGQALFQGPLATATAEEAAAWKPDQNYTYVVQVDHISLFLRRLQVNDKIYAHHTQMLKTKVARYYGYSLQTTFLNLPVGVLDYQSAPLFSPSVNPVKLFLTFFTPSTLQGDITKNIQSYIRPEEIRSIAIEVDNQNIQTFRNHHIQEFDEGALDFLYMNLFQTLQVRLQRLLCLTPLFQNEVT